MSTPEAEDQVTAADLYRWAGHYEDVDPGHAIELSQSASALEARDARIAELEAELEEAKANGLPDEEEIPNVFLAYWGNAIKTAHDEYALCDIPQTNLCDSLWTLHKWLEGTPRMAAARAAAEEVTP